MSASAAAARAIEILGEVGIPDPAVRARQYPHELSGGLRQRVLIGIAWACSPELVIADEPTSALDATVQRHVLDRMQALAEAHGTAVVLVTHDLAVAADRADHIVVMEQGLVVESGRARDVLAAPTHPYTQRLVAAAPGLNSRRLKPGSREDVASDRAPSALFARVGDPDRAESRDARPLIEVDGLAKTYAARGAAGVPAVGDVSFAIERGTTFSIVGESGSGKSTTARLVARIIDADAGRVRFDGSDITQWRGEHSGSCVAACRSSTRTRSDRSIRA